MTNKPSLQNKKNIIAQQRTEMFSGPLPHPEIIRQYDEICPGTAEKIVDSFVKQTNHRIDMETRVIKSSVFRANVGLFMAFIISLICLYIAYKLFNDDKSLYGLGLVILNLATLISVFIKKSNDKNKELKEKEENLKNVSN
ncbi:hypothetical protein HMPREF1634_07440 [Tissierellia bacterium S7-1-4]|nr:hypothetical protein HMPREF1634_07440 [Tissierellia bacterium S7-1-4]